MIKQKLKADYYWLFFSGFFLFIWVESFLDGSIYIPAVRRSASDHVELAQDPESYWLLMNFMFGYGVFGIFCVFYEVTPFTKLANYFRARAETEKNIKLQRSIFWKIFYYVVVPLSLVTLLMALLIKYDDVH